jgi:tetratricopeptide (TPR) repeat protein
MHRARLGALLLPGTLLVVALAARPGADTPDRSAPASPQQAAPPAALGSDAVIVEATRAVEVGTAGSARARYAARLRQRPGDRDAMLALATVARLTYEFDEADSLYRGLIAGAPLSDPHAVRARLGLAQGMDAHGMKEGLEAQLDSARRGAAAAHDRRAEAEANFWMSHTLAGVYGGGYALAHLDTALALAPPTARDVRADARCRRGQIMGVVGAPGARESLAVAQAFANEIVQPSAQATCWRGLGTYHEIQGAIDSSLAAYDSLIALRRHAHDRSGLAVALTLRADAMRTHGDFGGALRLFREALAEARASRNLYIQATGTLGLGGMALTLNDVATADAHVGEAIRAFEVAHDSAGAMLARSFLPFISLAAGDYALARKQVATVLPWAEGVGDWAHVSELYTQLAGIEMRARDWTAAERALRAAATASRKLGAAKEALVAFPRGRLALYRGDLATAEREFRRFLRGLDSTQHIQRYETRAYLADALARHGDLASAERELVAASDELDAWRASLTDTELRLMVFQAGASEANDRNASVARVIAALAAGGRVGAALGLAERRRARELSDRLTQVAALRGAGTPDSARARSSGIATPRKRGTDVSIGSTSTALTLPDERTALLEFVTGTFGAPTTLFVLAPRSGAPASLTAHVLPSADSLVDDVARFTGLVEQGARADALARSLAGRLTDSALADAGAATRLVIVADGPLHRIPWDALRSSDGRFLVERYAISLAPSAAVLRALHARASNAAPLRLLAYGDPAFAGATSAATHTSAGGEAELYRSAFDSAGGLPRLEASAREAELVARFADAAEVRTREQASAAYLKHAPLDGFRVLHLATHALVDERAVTRTALAVAPGEGESGFLGPSDLASLKLDADLVVLSACRSAGGVLVDGEGVQGLTAPLLEAGARAVVATQWRIGDRSTVGFVDAFYRAMANGSPVSEALQAAKLAALRRGAPAREWAAFTVIGDPLRSVPLHTPRPGMSRWLIPVAVLLVLLLGYGVVMRRRPTGELR